MNKSKRHRLLCAMLALSLCLTILPTSAGAARASSEIKEELGALKDKKADIQAELNSIRQQYNATANQIQDIVNRKDAVDQEIALLHEQVLVLNQEIADYGQLIADSQDELEDAQVRLDVLNEKHKERIRAMEEAGKVTYWEVLFKSKSFTELLDRLTLIEEISAADQRRIDEIQNVAREVSNTQTQMLAELTALSQSQAELRSSEAELEIKRTESDALLRDLIVQEEAFQLLLDDSEAKQDALMKEIAQKQKELSNAEYEEKLAKLALQGQNPPSNATWLIPVSGYTITSPFGMRVHPVYKYQLMHNGIDMACPLGTPIYATRAGSVTRAAYQAGGAGYYVSINHGDGFGSIYMHMTNYVVSAGQQVSAGQLLGYVGSTGVSTGPHLHFGISYAGTYVNPMAYIG